MQISDADVKTATTEFLSHKGENPYRVTRRGAELWEDYAPAMRVALSALSPPVQPVAGAEILATIDQWRAWATTWAATAFVANEALPRDGMTDAEHKSELYGDLCKMMNHMAWLHDNVAALATPPVPPTKGPGDDLPEGWEGSADAMVWAKAYRHFVLKNNLTMSEAIDPGYMVGWFANYWAAITRDRLEPSAEDDLIAALREISVACHRAKWEFDGTPAFDVLHRIGDLALRSRPASALPVVGERIKPLEWYPDPGAFPYNTWGAQSSFGRFIIEEVSASDSPAYEARYTPHHLITIKDSLEDAKAAAQADYERRILSALIPSVQP